MDSKYQPVVDNAVKAAQETLKFRPFWHKRFQIKKHGDLPRVGLPRRKVLRKAA